MAYQNALLREQKTVDALDHLRIYYPDIHEMYWTADNPWRKNAITEFSRMLYDVDNKRATTAARAMNRAVKAENRAYMQMAQKLQAEQRRLLAAKTRGDLVERQKQLAAMRKEMDSSDEGGAGDVAGMDSVRRELQKTEQKVQRAMQDRMKRQVGRNYMGSWDIMKQWMPSANDLIWTFVPPGKYLWYMGTLSDMGMFMNQKFSQTRAEQFLGAFARGSAGLTKKPYRRDFRNRLYNR
jgi:exonuclease VII large subunit